MSAILETAFDPVRKAQADAADKCQALTAWGQLPGFIRRAPGPTAAQVAAVIAALGGLPLVQGDQSLSNALDAAHEFAGDMQ